MNFPEELIEQVARVIHDSQWAGDDWHGHTESARDEWRDVAHSALSAAAPTLMAQAWDECMATIDDNAWIDWTVETPPTNPYKESP